VLTCDWSFLLVFLSTELRWVSASVELESLVWVVWPAASVSRRRIVGLVSASDMLKAEGEGNQVAGEEEVML